jgi:hypothetical protein
MDRAPCSPSPPSSTFTVTSSSTFTIYTIYSSRTGSLSFIRASPEVLFFDTEQVSSNSDTEFSTFLIFVFGEGT